MNLSRSGQSCPPRATSTDRAVGCLEVTYSRSLDPEVRTCGAATAGAPTTRPYRFSAAFQDNTLAQGTTVTVTFTGEAPTLEAGWLNVATDWTG